MQFYTLLIMSQSSFLDLSQLQGNKKRKFNITKNGVVTKKHYDPITT